MTVGALPVLGTTTSVTTPPTTESTTVSTPTITIPPSTTGNKYDDRYNDDGHNYCFRNTNYASNRYDELSNQIICQDGIQFSCMDCHLFLRQNLTIIVLNC